jgi:hypothetical protein
LRKVDSEELHSSVTPINMIRVIKPRRRRRREDMSTHKRNKVKVEFLPYLIKQHAKKTQGSTELHILFIWFVRLLALRPLLAYCASLG